MSLLAPGVALQSVDEDKVVLSAAVLHVGKETLYRRGKLLIVSNASDVDVEKDRDKIIPIDRFSTEYFALVAANSKSDNAVLARQEADQEMIVRLRGKIYRIK